MKSNILIKRKYLLSVSDQKDENAPFYAVKLLNTFGVVVDKPSFLTKTHVNVIANFFGESIPNSFYANPQDLAFYTDSELYLEQLISYLKIEHDGEYSIDEDTFKRIPLFKKALPTYKDGNEIILRKYKIINSEQADKILAQVANSYTKYTRPWSINELEEFLYLYNNGFYNGEQILCKDNIISVYVKTKNESLCKFLDYKDVVKLSLLLVGEEKEFTYTNEQIDLVSGAILNAKPCILTKKQAKYFNTSIKKCGIKMPKRTNADSPYAISKKLVSEGKILEATEVLSKHGSLLERNIIWLLSRANLQDAVKILDVLLSSNTNPIVLLQLIQTLSANNFNEYRTFVFYKNNLRKSHTETDYEFAVRKSRLSIGVINAVKELIQNKLNTYYLSLPKLGKIYINEEFKKVALPINTTSCGTGLDVLPSGSRIKIDCDYIRAFCYWNNVFDIDASVILIDENDISDSIYWGNYSSKRFGKSALHSGDSRGINGAEFIDFKISELKALGFKYAILSLNGYGGALNEGEIYCGYQNKEDLKTKAWSAKNIKTKIQVVGSSRAYMAFAIDLETSEMIILNTVINSFNLVVDENLTAYIKVYLSKDYLNYANAYNIIQKRGELVTNKETADVIFDSEYIGNENQKVIRPYNIEELVNLLK